MEIASLFVPRLRADDALDPATDAVCFALAVDDSVDKVSNYLLPRWSAEAAGSNTIIAGLLRRMLLGELPSPITRGW